MAQRKSGNTLGSWSFLIGVILALLVGIFGSLTATMVYILIILGIIVGLLNVADEEVEPFLMAGTVLVIVSALGQSVVSSVSLLENTLQALAVLFVPATIIVALKHVFSLARH